jgi:hypothetical protein
LTVKNKKKEMENYNKIVALIELMKEDVDKFFDKGNKSAGTRVRTACQDLKKLAQELRVDVQDAKKTTK